MRPQNTFRNCSTSMSLTSKWTFFFSWSMFDASQLPAYTACFRLPVKHSTGCSWGTFGGVAFEPSRTLCSWRSSNHLLPSFPALERLHGPSFSCGMLCHPPWRHQCGWPSKHHMQLNFKPSLLQLTPVWWLDEALASLRYGLGADSSRSILLLCCFSILKWLENMEKQSFLQNPAF